MPRPEKVAAVEEIKARFEDSGGVILTEYRGLRVGDMQRLRRELRGVGTELKIVKNTLARRAVEGSSYAEIVQFFEGPVAIAFYADDPIPAAKLLRGFASEHPSLVIKGGLLSGEVIDAASARKLADLESREALLARFAATLQAPLAKMAGASSALIRNFGYALGGYLSSREEETASAEAEAAPEAETAPGAEEPGPSSETDAVPEASEHGESEVVDSHEDLETTPDTDKETSNGEADD